MPSNFKALAGAAGGGDLADPNFKNVTLLLHGDGSNGAQNNTFIDSSTNNFTITRNGNTTQGSFSPYGSNWSNYFDGSGDYLTAGNNSAFAFGTGDFTVETWVFPTVNTGGFQIFFDTRNGGSDTAGIVFTIYNNQFGVYRGSLRAFGSVTFNQWTHYAVTRSGGTMRAFINGTQVDTWTDTTTLSSDNSVIGMTNETGNYFNGYLSNLRVLKGTALYTSNFTPSTTPLTAITNTSLLTCAYNRFRDGSTNNFTITRNGDVKVTNFAPFAPSSAYSTTTNGGSAYFDGSGDYLSAPTNTALDCGTGDWTIECWTYISTRTNSYPLVFGNNRGSWTTDALALTNSNADNASYNDKFVFGWNNGGFISPSAGNSQLLVSNVTNELNTWHHLALVRNGTSIKMYRNGVEVASATISSGASFNWGYNGALVGGGNWDGAGSYYNGYISNLRLVKGTAVYTAAFTPPSSPVTAITNTSLLLNATNAAIFDNSMKNDLETVGNAQISTSVKKFGTGSMAFDGTGDSCRIAIDDPNLQFNTGNFTAEGWIYSTGGTGTYQHVLTGGTSWTTNSGGIYWYYNGGSPTLGAAWNHLPANPAVNSGTLAINTWHHFALVRNGNTLTLYINGTSVSTYSVSGYNLALNNQSRTNIGGGGWDNDFAGHIDDLRITKGVARYTSNFTAPSAPFPNK